MQVNAVVKRTELSILRDLNIILEGCLSGGRGDDNCLPHLQVAEIVMDKLLGLFPRKSYPEKAVSYYLRLRRAYRSNERRVALKRKISKRCKAD